jgi:hypothetical protein
LTIASPVIELLLLPELPASRAVDTRRSFITSVPPPSSKFSKNILASVEISRNLINAN